MLLLNFLGKASYHFLIIRFPLFSPLSTHLRSALQKWYVSVVGRGRGEMGEGGREGIKGGSDFLDVGVADR